MAIYDPPKPTVKLMLEIGMPAPLPTGPRPVQESEKKPPVEDQVREMLDCIDSGRDSQLEWATINKLYNALSAEKKTPRIRNLMKMMEPILSKYGQHQVSEKE